MAKYYLRAELEELIEEYVLGFRADRNKEIIRDKLIHGMSIKEVALKYHLSETRVKTVIRTFKRTLSAHGK